MKINIEARARRWLFWGALAVKLATGSAMLTYHALSTGKEMGRQECIRMQSCLPVLSKKEEAATTAAVTDKPHVEPGRRQPIPRRYKAVEQFTYKFPQ